MSDELLIVLLTDVVLFNTPVVVDTVDSGCIVMGLPVITDVTIWVALVAAPISTNKVNLSLSGKKII